MSKPAGDPSLKPVMTVDELNRFIGEAFPQLNEGRADYAVTGIFPGGCTVRLNAGHRHLRPGGTVSGPTFWNVISPLESSSKTMSAQAKAKPRKRAEASAMNKHSPLAHPREDSAFTRRGADRPIEPHDRSWDRHSGCD